MRIRRFTGGVLLVTGTCIGAGMLALPMTLAQSGFWLSNVLLLITWMATCLSGLFVLEANLALPEGANYISMARATLGKPGEVAAWLTYLMLLYSLMAAYLSAGGDIVDSAISGITHLQLSNWVGPIPWVLAIGAVIYTGARFVDGLNRVLIIGLILTYLMLVVMSVPHTQGKYLAHHEFGHFLPSLPILVTAFGYHVIIPSLRRYLRGDAARLNKMIIIGSILPLIVYILWNMVVFGTVSVDGPHGLVAIANAAHPTVALTQAMSTLIGSPALVTIAESFIFFAIASSFLGIAFSLFDFLTDGFLAHDNKLGRAAILLATFIPPLLYALYYPRGFILALSYAGIFVAILHGILPVMMVYFGRKKEPYRTYTAPTGNAGLFFIFAASVLVIVMQLLHG